MKNESYLEEWIVCPECGHNDFHSAEIPDPVAGRNGYITCPECGHKGVVVG